MIIVQLEKQELIELIKDCVRDVLKETETQRLELANPPEQLFTVQEAAAFLNLTVPTIYSKVSKGELPFMKRSKRVYFSRTELMDYLKGGDRSPKAVCWGE